MRRGDEVGMAEQRIGLGRLFDEDVEGGARDMAAVERRALSAASSTRPPRAQLMMRTPFLVLAMFSAERMLLRLRGHRRVQGDEVGAGEQIVELDLLDADLRRRARGSGTGSRR